jgi:hypothetical protein
MTIVQAFILFLQVVNLILAASVFRQTLEINKILVQMRKLEEAERKSRPYDLAQLGKLSMKNPKE